MTQPIGRRRGGPGRRSKGDRHPFQVRIPREVAERVMDYAVITDQSYSDVIAGLVVRHAEEFDVEGVQLGTNRLDVEAHRQSA